MKIVAFFHLNEVKWALADADRRRLEERFPGARVISVEDSADLRRQLADADVFLGWVLPQRHFAAAKRLRWMQSASAGIEANLYPAMLESDVLLTSAAGIHTISIPEHVIGQMAILARNFHQALRQQAKAEWNRFGVISFAGGVRELHGSALAILGAGPIGGSLAALAAGLGMRVRVLRRNPSQPVAGAEAVLGPGDLHELLGWADWVVCALPLTAETTDLIDAAAIAAMRSDAFLINIGRGETVDEEALLEALRRGGIAGAALDVFREEPLPPGHPFWSLPNLVITPHISGYTPKYMQAVLALFEDNLARFLAGRPLRNLVDKRLGYAPGS